MPKDGFTSITMRDDAYNEIHNWYISREKNLISLGINSFSAVITSIVLSAMKPDGLHLKELQDVEPDKK